APLPPEHPDYCNDHPECPAGSQNDWAHLLDRLGPADPGDDSGGTTSSGGEGGGTDSGGDAGTETGTMSDTGDAGTSGASEDTGREDDSKHHGCRTASLPPVASLLALIGGAALSGVGRGRRRRSEIATQRK